LDADTEQRLVRSLAEWGRGRCIFLVTHRLSTVRLASRVVFLDLGKVVEVGAPAELLARSGSAYRALVEAERREAGGGGGARRSSCSAARCPSSRRSAVASR